MKPNNLPELRLPSSTSLPDIAGSLGLALPLPDLRHLRTLTDDTGILQHACYIVPDRDHGYCVDDNARALLVACRHYALFGDQEILGPIAIYLSFVLHAFNPRNGRFRNFMSYDRRWLEEQGSEDSHGRALWGLGVAARRAPNGSQRHLAAELFARALDPVESFTSPRARAFAVLGLDCYLEYHGENATARYLQAKLAGDLFALFEENCSSDWEWCEDIVSYSNGKLVEAILIGGRALSDERMIDRGLRALKWLLRVQTSSRGHVGLVGNGGWMVKGGERSRFDQQPVDAAGLVDACLAAYRVTGERAWIFNALVALRWFLGYNDLGIPLYDESTGGCCDGLQPQGVNANQGAESTLAWLIALIGVREVTPRNGVLPG